MTAVPDDFARHCRKVAQALANGRVVPFLGAGVNLCDRPQGVPWSPDAPYLPDGPELSSHLAKHFEYEDPDKSDLLRVSQFADADQGEGPLYEELHKVFNKDIAPTSAHRLLAALPKLLKDRHYPPEPRPLGYELLVVTTNYDDLLERAFREAEQEFDLVTYVATGEHRGRFLHTRPDGTSTVIERPNEYHDVSLSQRMVIMKIHGAVERSDSHLHDSYVITEDNYIDYLARGDISNLIPVHVKEELQRSHFLFLGYSLRDWNLRVILRRIWGESVLSYRSWAIQRGPSQLDTKLWQRRGVDIISMSLRDYITELGRHLDQLPALNAPGTP